MYLIHIASPKVETATIALYTPLLALDSLVTNNNVYLSSSNTELGVTEVDWNANSFLAKYVSAVDISPSEYNCLTDNIEIIDVNINMEYGTVLSQLNQTIRLRNGQ